MPSRLYLDTARMGKVSPTAMAIQTDYLRFSAERGCSDAMRSLLLRGGDAWPSRFRRKYPALASWHGVGPLKDRLRQIVGGGERSRVILASRSHVLMTLASYLLFGTCETVLTVDLAWPPYREILKQVADKLGRRVVVVAVRQIIDAGGDAGSVIGSIVDAYRQSRPAALFLPAISHDGVKLPIRRISDAIKSKRESRFFVVDGAQHLAHGDAPVAEMDCDFYLAGTHKWLRSLYPLGIGVCGHPRSREMIGTTVTELHATGILTDPLTQFTSQLESQKLDGATETVNLSGLLSAHGAALDARPASARRRILSTQLVNANMLSVLAEDAGWRPVLPAAEFRSGILLLRPPLSRIGDSAVLRNHLESRGVAATTYDSGVVRFSMPRRSLPSDYLIPVRRALDIKGLSSRL
jgi:hypothetical protein